VFFGSSYSKFAQYLIGTALIALAYFAALYLNSLPLFSWAEFDNYRFVFFFPAGVKLALILMFGWQALPGIALALGTALLTKFEGIVPYAALGYGVALACSAHLAVQACSQVTGKRFPWQGLRPVELLAMVAAVSVLDAVVQQCALILLTLETVENFVTDTLLSAFGRASGALCVFGGLAFARKSLHRALH